jgi:hypothetical protein
MKKSIKSGAKEVRFTVNVFLQPRYMFQILRNLKLTRDKNMKIIMSFLTILLVGCSITPVENAQVLEVANNQHEESYEKQWKCRAFLGDEAVVKLAFINGQGFVTMLDQKYIGNYNADGLIRAWYFGESKDAEHYRYLIELNARGTAYLYDFYEVEGDEKVEAEEMLKCTLNKE